MNNYNLTTPRDVRLHLASLLELLEQVQNSESWEVVATEHPILNEQFQVAQSAVDDLWFKFRCATTNASE